MRPQLAVCIPFFVVRPRKCDPTPHTDSPMKGPFPILCLTLCAPFALSLTAKAASVVKASTGTDLTDGASWGGTAPTPSDIATWTGGATPSLGGSSTLGSDTQWQGIAITGASSDVSISGAGTLTLGSSGIDLSNSTVNLSVANNIALSANQTWQAAAGKTISVSGVISGSSGLTFGALAQSVTTTTFLTGTAQDLFPNLSLSSVVATSGKMGGGYVNNGVPISGNGYLLSNNGTTATYWLEAVDGTFTKGVEVELDQVGADVTAKAIAAKYTSGANLGFNFNTGGNAGTVATSQTANGYGAYSTTLKFGYDATGTILLSGLSTYTGPTVVNAGTFRAGIASVAGVGGAFGNNSAVTMANNANATIDLNGFNTQIGSITGGAAGGNVTLGSATLTVGGDNTSPAAFGGTISGTGGLVKIGSGTQILSGSNTYSGGTSVNGGALTLSGTAGYGGANGSVGTGSLTIAPGATVTTTGNFDISGLYNSAANRATVNVGGTLSLAGNEYLNGVTLTGGQISASGVAPLIRTANPNGFNIATNGAAVTATISAPIDMTYGSIVATVAQGTVSSGQDLVISGNITQNTGAGSGAKSLTKNGAGTLVLNGVNSYTGGTTIAGGTLVLSGSGTLGANTGAVTFSGASTLDLGGGTPTVGAVTFSSASGGATIQNGTLSAASITAQSSAGTDTINVVVQGAGALTKSGAGTLVLSQANTYSGGTSVSGGTLVVSGSISGSTNVTGGALAGSGFAGPVNVSTGGTLAPGPVGAIGSLLTQDLTFNGGTLAMNLNTSTGTSSQELVNGNLTLGTGAVLALNELGSNVALATGLTLDLVQYSGNWDGGIFQFNGTSLPEGSSFTFGANRYQIDYQVPSGTLSAVALTVMVPEPGAASSLACGLLLLAGLGRGVRRSKRAHA